MANINNSTIVPQITINGKWYINPEGETKTDQVPPIVFCGMKTGPSHTRFSNYRLETQKCILNQSNALNIMPKLNEGKRL
jgi:hypothetical protein